ncbi:hypothetical protein F5B22DRAFT_640159 [Xylaria bambusicola]|uniref:uncharacterized protein n=1 Tax=Xylaria bambusicola TaxID=326684 RepID=UPI002007DC50|nr:uncharacterized protein F5B22DRAFT_640159 [Xylaria bambusicola]KAI0503435.1 hypothetical protein F5B22DRAFT_640159 [Xylaria bambusicola]
MKASVTEGQHGDDSSDSDARGAHELRLWPPPRLQAYCLDHFLMECEIYHEQENDRYKKLVAHSRESFLKKITSSSSNPQQPIISAPTRRQPSRRAKEKHSVIGTPSSLNGPPRPRKLSIAPFKPAKLEKAFKESPQGTMFRILNGFWKKLELHKSWAAYRSVLERKVQELVRRLEAETGEGKPIHKDCVFRGPLGVECRYCGFVATVHEDAAVTPRKLAPPAAMRAIRRLSEGSDDTAGSPRLELRGTDMIVDICSGKAMIVLVNLKGVLDLCAEALGDEEVVLASPTSLSARLSTIQTPSSTVTRAKRWKETERETPRRNKRRKSEVLPD